MNAFYCEVTKVIRHGSLGVMVILDFMLPGYAVSTTAVVLKKPLTLFCFRMGDVGSGHNPKFAAYSIAGGIRHGHV